MTTNNIAEYTALAEGLKKAIELGYDKIQVNADSELMVKQLNGEYKVKNPDIKKIYTKIKELEIKFTEISYNHIPREQNTRADELANQAL